MIPTAPFGSTGHQSSRVIFGAAALGGVAQDKADRLLEVLLEHGVNHIDTAAAYGDSELRIGPWMREHRKSFFLATKTGDRTRDGARDSLHRSLDRLRVDQVDLIQLHNLAEEDEWQKALGSGGALEALVEARSQGLTRFIGVTGHGSRIPAMHRRSLERFAFDSILFPYNFTMMSIAEYAAEAQALIETCQRTRYRRADHQVGGAPAMAKRRDPQVQLVRADPRPRSAAPRGPFHAQPAGTVFELIERRDAPARHPRRRW